MAYWQSKGLNRGGKKTQQILDGFASILTKYWQKSACKNGFGLFSVTLKKVALRKECDDT